MSLVQAIARNRGPHEVLIALNGLFPDSIEPIRSALDGVIPQDSIRVWNSPGPVSFNVKSNEFRRQAAELVREAFLTSLRPDLVHVSSLFEGLIDDAVTSVGLFAQSIPTAITLYDLIPLVNRKPYLEDPVTESWYESKIGHLRRGNLWLAISESSRQEGIKYLNLPEEWAVNISTAADAHFKASDVPAQVARAIRDRFGLTRPFVMYTGGIDHRKNVEGLIRAFAQLPPDIRVRHQLAIVCSVQPDTRRNLEQLAQQHGLDPGDLALTGFVSDSDLVNLYRMCKVFVFPSWHEGFGLPALEAMSCGAPTIGANSASVPEVIGREDALFDPHSDESISLKIAHVLTDDTFRANLIRHGQMQAGKFSWDESSRRALVAFERMHAFRKGTVEATAGAPRRRPRLAYVSPLPPARSGIADYSSELLPELNRYYDVSVIVAQEKVSDSWIRANCEVHSVDWFAKNADHFQRVLYHFGNSDNHHHMFAMLDRVPGIVVLHDFFLSNIVAYMDWHGLDKNAWARELYRAHGYQAVRERFHATDTDDVVWRFPCNLGVLRRATGVIVHSQFSRRLADEWYGAGASSDWRVIPLLRKCPIVSDRQEAREQLGFPPDSLVVCSFGGLGPTKLNSRLLDCWLKSDLAKNSRCFLIFAGENDWGPYGDRMTEGIRNSGLSDRIQITGWLDESRFRAYLAAVDIAVQLRTLSRGETSATVLDCMARGLSTVVNANGAMAELSPDSLFTLPDEFDDSALIDVLQTLSRDEVLRSSRGEQGREVIRTKHGPRRCAQIYFEAIEHFHREEETGRSGLIRLLAQRVGTKLEENLWFDVSTAIAGCMPKCYRTRQLLVDVSELVLHDAKTGVQRVVRGILTVLLNSPPAGLRVEPVYANADRVGYRYARQFSLQYLDCPDQAVEDMPIEVFPGDVFLGLDLQPYVIPRQAAFFEDLRRIGVRVYFVVYDLLPVLLPSYFVGGSNDAHMRWLHTIQQSDGAVCISRAVADELQDWLTVFGQNRLRPFHIGWFHVGVPVVDTSIMSLQSGNGDLRPANVFKHPTFIMVGTVEPRKGHAQVLAAFERLWREGIDAKLIIVGKQGWMVDSLTHELRHHPEAGRKLLWMETVSDEQLANLYSTSTCLIAASEGEGFGLPLIEAAQYRLPIIARDIPVFREVAGEHAHYFSGFSASSLADAVSLWLERDRLGTAPQSGEMPRSTWEESARQLLDVVLQNRWYQRWMPSVDRRFWGSDPRLSTQVGKRVGREMVSTGLAGCLIHGPYLKIEAGTYQILINGKFGNQQEASALADIAVDKGTRILNQVPIMGPDANGRLASLTVSVPEDSTDFEVRIFVNSDSDVIVSSLEIRPLHQPSSTGIASSDRARCNPSLARG